MKKTDIRRLCIYAMLIAIDVVLARFLSVNAWNVRIGFSFVPVVVAALLYGPVAAAVIHGIADILGALLFPTGTFFPGFTLTAAVLGLIYGLFLKGRERWVFALLAVLCGQIVCTLLLNTAWISILYGSPFVPLLGTRLIQAVITAPVQFIVILALQKFAPALKKAARAG